ncbi:ABC transporter ATP-binding protein [Mycetocola spongiae]|uniref:ABC transporter ATP-binding protein n=1 Tax=Mycetocola spongiae TaxID=2859226 RepID=UPI001CF108D6|nr:ABC transporter ATP-binding protein [Mycetocola spongiae]UCR87876.1 ABC transporter ATP-binding protein [Mycetocola spongiae]
MSADPILSLTRVTKEYPTSPPTRVLEDTSLEFLPGELVAIVGPSGSGKTTLLSIMGTLENPSTGEVYLAGERVAGLGDPRRAALRAEYLAFIFQQFFLVPSLSALQNVATGLLYTGAPRRERLRRAEDALRRVGLAERLGHRPGQLSGGQQQRVAIARALVKSPRIIFADEPTGALDTATGAEIMTLLRDLAAEGTTVIVITHDQQIAAGMPRRITIRDGSIITDERDES